jgi:hypothetical protein
MCPNTNNNNRKPMISNTGARKLKILLKKYGWMKGEGQRYGSYSTAGNY